MTDIERRLLAVLVELHGYSLATAVEWLHRPNPRFANRSPSEIVASPESGFGLVLRGLDPGEDPAGGREDGGQVSAWGADAGSPATSNALDPEPFDQADVALLTVTLQGAGLTRVQRMLHALDASRSRSGEAEIVDPAVEALRATVARLQRPEMERRLAHALHRALEAHRDRETSRIDSQAGVTSSIVASPALTDLEHQRNPISRVVIAWIASALSTR